MTREQIRLAESQAGRRHWKRWGPYLSERAWGTVREDYSEEGTAWEYFPHDHARSRAYRWSEDGIAGICDDQQLICFSIALWNGRDPILKERLFGLTGHEGNHGEDVKEYYFYLDSTPTHSYMKYLYKYAQSAFPYSALLETNRQRSRTDPEYELLETGVFDDDRYFDVFVEYAKADVEDILIRVTVINRGPEPATLDLLPTVWFRNTWSWGMDARRPRLKAGSPLADAATIAISHFDMDDRSLLCQAAPELLFTENETNFQRLFGVRNATRYVKDGINDYVINGARGAVNAKAFGTKAAVRYRLSIDAGGSVTVKLRLTPEEPHEGALGRGFDEVFSRRIREADEFYDAIAPPNLTGDERLVQRQAFAGMLWNKQFYHYDVRRWLRGDATGPEPPRQRQHGPNAGWTHLRTQDVISMPDKWEYPWFAAWDLAFHCIPLALIDPDFAKEQLLLLLRERYMHPNGQLPACEWNFSDVNPPVHAWAAWRVYKIEQKHSGRRDRIFLESVFHKLLLNFTWWVNRKDAEGNNVFQGGFLGLDNIGVLDRSAMLATGHAIEQSDATSWMGMYCLNMMIIALELSRENPAYEGLASKFLEHFAYISRAMNNIAGQDIQLWNREDGFYYDVLRLSNGRSFPMRVRSLVGLFPLFAVETIESEVIDTLPGFKQRMQWFIDNLPEFSECIETRTTATAIRRFLSLVSQERLRRVLTVMLDESEFLSPYGIRSLSRIHAECPYTLSLSESENLVSYDPAESRSGLVGGNSNWRGPVWFPVNFLIIESLQKFHHFLGESFRVECPSRSGRWMNLWQVSIELQDRLTRIFLRDDQGRRPVYANIEKFQRDPHWRDLLLFFEYFHGDDGSGRGASHQTGWTGLVAKMLQQRNRREDRDPEASQASEVALGTGRL
jgi:mannosylglycerate hydrolase MGH1-like protein